MAGLHAFDAHVDVASTWLRATVSLGEIADVVSTSPRPVAARWEELRGVTAGPRPASPHRTGHAR